MGIVVSQKFFHPVLGRINIKVLSTARRVTARWKANIIHITIPPGIETSEFLRIIERMTPEIQAMRPVIGRKYFDGYSFSNDLIRIKVVEYATIRRGDIEAIPLLDCEPKGYEFRVAPGTLDDDEMQLRLKKFIEKCTFRPADFLLHTELYSIVEELGYQSRVTDFAIARSSAKLGTCSENGKISLAARLIYMPEQIRRAVMTHELAHLDHFDHTPEFYARWQQLFSDFDVHTLKKHLKTLDLPI